MKRNTKTNKGVKYFALLLAFVLTVCTIPSIALANGGTDVGAFTVEGGTLGEDYSFDGATLTVNTSTNIKIIGDSNKTDNKIIINNNVTANVTIENINIYVDIYTCALEVHEGATLNLTVEGENTLSSGRDRPGIQLDKSALVITEQSTGKLTAIGRDLGAGIGGSDFDVSEGSITINGGTIIAQGNNSGAGIGSGFAYNNKQTGDGFDITINGGNVTATSDNIGIGGASNRTNKSVTINGGVVKATGRYYGIGDYSNSFVVNINGGKVEASSTNRTAFLNTPVLTNNPFYTAFYGDDKVSAKKLIVAKRNF